MASFMSSIMSTYRTFGAALLEAKDNNPKLDLDEFMKTFFAGEVAFVAAPVIDAKVTQTKATKPREIGKKKAAPKNPCTAVTAKGTQCTKCAVGTGPFCTIHLKKNDGNGKKKPKKETKEVPKHNHPPNKKEDGKPCELCDTHGDVTNEEENPEFEMEEEVTQEVSSNHGDPDYVLGEDEFDED